MALAFCERRTAVRRAVHELCGVIQTICHMAQTADQE